jgi:hypothetical protein
MKLRSKYGDGRVRPLLVLALAVLLLSPSAMAQRMHRSSPSQWHGNVAGLHQFNRGAGNISGFHQHNGAAWRGGHWIHGPHHGHLGWWWVAGGLWYWYPGPVYPYPYEPSVALVSPALNLPPPTQNWYYCEASGTYYPYVTACPGGWQEVPPTPKQDSLVPPQ